MTEPNYTQIAAAVLAKCVAYDEYRPNPSAETARHWGALFAKHQLSAEDLLTAVEWLYSTHGHYPNGERYKPLPADIVDAARAIRRDRAARQPAIEESDDPKAEARAEAINTWARGYVALPSGPKDRSPAYTESGAIDMACPQCEAEAGQRCHNPITGRPARMPCLARLVDGFEPVTRKQLGRDAKLPEDEARRLARRMTTP